MQKKWMFLLVLVVGALFFRGTLISKRSSIETPLRALDPSVTSIEPTSRRADNSTIKNQDRKLNSVTNSQALFPDLDDEETKCWEKINSQIASNEFLPRNRDILNKVVGPWYDSNSESVKPEGSIQGRFLLALARADLLQGRHLQVDNDEALMLLEDVIDEDPTNSAPFLYAAIIARRTGQLERATYFLSRAKASNHFDSYVTDYSRTLFAQVQTSSDLIEAISNWAQAPIPDYVALKDMLIINEDTQFAHQLLAGGLTEGKIDLDWIPVEYAIGRAVLEKTHSAAPYPSYRDLIGANRKKLQMFDGELMSNLIRSSCNVDSLAPLVSSMQSYFSK